MIMLYFSATGNSKYIAKLFSKKMNSLCQSIEEKANFKELISSNDVIGFCYPIYGSRVPKLMRDFVTTYKDSFKDKKIIIFCTQLYFSGDGARVLTDLFPPKFVNVIYAEHFLMPNNINNFFIMPLANEKSINKYIVRVRKKMSSVCRDIKKGVVRKKGFNPLSRGLGLIQGASFPKIEEKAKSMVWIDSDCNQCKLCVKICPMKNFEYEDQKIVTKNNCMLCYRCINKCPKKAISICLHSKVKKQYKGVL